jgi:hypothetical protein
MSPPYHKHEAALIRLRKARSGSPVRTPCRQHFCGSSGGPAAVANLQADDQEACDKLWADVAALLKNVVEKK